MLDIIKEFLENAKERIKSPLIGTFITSWIIFNWKPILILFFSTGNIENRIAYLEKTYTNSYTLLIYPLIVTVIYIFGLPYINLWIDKLLSDSNIKRKNRINLHKIKAIDDEIAIEEAKIRLEVAKANYMNSLSINEKMKELDNQIHSLNTVISENKEQYTQEIKEAYEENNKLKNTIVELNNQISALHAEASKVYEFIEAHPFAKSSFVSEDFAKAFNSYANNSNEIYNSIAKSFKRLNLNGLSQNDFANLLAKSIKNEKSLATYAKGLRKITGIDDPLK